MPRRLPSFLSQVTTFALAAIVGTLGGLTCVGFHVCAVTIQDLAFGKSGRILEVALQAPWWQRLLVPTAGAFVGALILRYLQRQSTGFGIVDLIEFVSLRRREIHAVPTLVRTSAAIASIATGGSLGREGPITHLGATIAALVARVVHLDHRRQAILLGCGVAAGMAAAYNTPIAGALFVMEVVLGNFAMEVLGPVVIASVFATLAVSELHPELDHAIYAIPHELTPITGVVPLLSAMLLGIPAGAVGVGFLRLLRTAGESFAASKLWAPLKAALGGLVVGVIGLWLPQVWGNGYQATDQILIGNYTLGVVLLLLVLKPIATAVTIGSGQIGGVFTPTLLLGAATGFLFHRGLEQVVPNPGMSASWGVVGMAAVMAGTTHAPIMSMILLLEMTQNHTMVLPLILATVVASLTAKFLGKDSLYTERLRQRGVPVDAGLEELTMHQVKVGDLMRSDIEKVHSGAALGEILQRFQATRSDVVYVVGDRGELLGHVDLHDVKDFLNQPGVPTVVIAADVMRSSDAAAPAESLAQVLEEFDDPELEELPVTTSSEEGGVLLGRITRRDLIAVLNLEVLKRQTLRAKFVVEGQREPNYVELPRGYSLGKIPVPAVLHGRTLAESQLRERFRLTVLSLVQREADGLERRIMPDGRTVLGPQQWLVVMGRGEDIEAFRKDTQ